MMYRLFSYLLCLVVVGSFLNVSNAYAAKATISIPPLENKARVDKAVADSMVDMLTTAFAKTRKFQVVERASLSNVVDEQMFAASGAVDSKTAAKFGKMTGANFVLVGAITTFGTDKKETGAFGVSVSSSSYKIGLDIRVVDTTTGEIKLAESYSRSDSDTGFTASASSVKHTSSLQSGPLADLARAVSNDIARETMFAVFPPKIVKVDESSVIVNYGDGILTVDDLYDVYSQGESIIDPDTGENLGSSEEFAGTVKVSRTTAKMSYADIIENKASIQAGMVLRPKRQEETIVEKVKVPW